MDIVLQLTKILTLSILGFLFAIAFAPLVEYLLKKYRLGKQIREEGAPIFYELHKNKEGTPTMGGILIWGTVLILILFFFLFKYLFNGAFDFLSFLDRRETLLPLGVLIASGIVGAIDDIFGILKIGPRGGGLRVKEKILIYLAIAIFGAWWFWVKLGFNSINIPFLGEFYIGIYYPLFFIFVIIATAFSANETDGLDGLLGGVMLSAFASYLVISFFLGKYNLASFLGTLLGALIGFLWFNIYPAKFFMGDTGSMSLGITLGVLALLTRTPLLLPLFALVLVIESLSVIIQQLSKKIRKKKIFLSTPIHHHFQAQGLPEANITMRFWMINAIGCALGLILFFIDKII